ncbi:MAG: AAA family ATPase, partial [Myxococcota bacterium]
MAESLSREVRTIRAQAEAMARATGRPVASVHYLVATYVVECLARELLVETGVDDVKVLDTFERMPERDEPAEILTEIHRQAEQLAESSNSAEVTSIILLASLLRVRNALASKVLDRAGVAVSTLRARVIGQLTLLNDRAATGLRPAVQRPEDPRPSISRTDLPRVTTRMDMPRTLTASDHLTAPTQTLPATPADLRPVPAETRGQPTAPTRIVSPEARPLPPAEVRPAPVESRPLPVEPRQAEVIAPKPPAPKPPTTGGRKTGPVRRVFDLSVDKFPTLNEIGRNLTVAALKGEIDPLIGRENLVDAVIDILLMKQVNNPCLIGEAGVGKTAIVEGLALRLAGNIETYGKLGSAVIVEIQTSALLAGTSLRGAFSERMRKLRDEVAAGAGQVIVFMDEIHTIMGAGTGDGPLDAANDLKSALSRGRFPLIGATTKAEYERHIEKDPAMERRFQVVEVPEPTVPEAIAILSGVAPLYAKHHQVCYSHDAITSAVHLSKRFINDRCLPDKAIAVLDRAGAQTRRAGRQVVQADDIARAVHVLTAVPMERLAADERGRIRDLAVDLQARIVGHDAAMQRIARRIQRNYAGFSGDRPLASFLFVGAPGVGKTETGRALAQALFVVDDALVRFDMNEYTESHSIARLIGSPPGYVGHAQAGLLAHALQKRPYRVLLFDEVDRAAPEVLALLLQLLDAGRVTDNHGQVVDVRNCILAMTSNQGAELLAAPNARRSIGFGRVDAPIPEGPGAEPVDQAVLDRARKALPADLWTRIDETIVFHPLSLHAGRQVVQRQLELSARRLYEARMIRYHADETVVDLVMGPGMDPSLGVRPLRARIEDVVEAFVTERILDGALKPGADVILTATDGRLELHPRAAVEPA